MIESFGNRETEGLYRRERTKRYAAIEPVAFRKLRQIANVVRLEELAVPPGNHLEALKGDRQSQHSIRINDQWRICFVWRNENAYGVEIVDYH